MIIFIAIHNIFSPAMFFLVYNSIIKIIPSKNTVFIRHLPGKIKGGSEINKMNFMSFVLNTIWPCR